MTALYMALLKEIGYLSVRGHQSEDVDAAKATEEVKLQNAWHLPRSTLSHCAHDPGLG